LALQRVQGKGFCSLAPNFPPIWGPEGSWRLCSAPHAVSPTPRPLRAHAPTCHQCHDLALCMFWFLWVGGWVGGPGDSGAALVSCFGFLPFAHPTCFHPSRPLRSSRCPRNPAPAPQLSHQHACSDGGEGCVGLGGRISGVGGHQGGASRGKPLPKFPPSALPPCRRPQRDATHTWPSCFLFALGKWRVV
jgi:hypothetical protein